MGREAGSKVVCCSETIAKSARRIARMKNHPKMHHMDVDGQKLAYTFTGSGRPTIVLINGLGVPLSAWNSLYPGLEKLGTVVAYDRSGVGGSSPPLVPQTGDVVVRMLRRLLVEAGAEGPYVLVGHSFGGLYANLFARQHPNDVAGVMFLEATAPEDVAMMKRHQGKVSRALNAMFSVFSRPGPNSELSNEAETVAQLIAAPAFPNVPLCVVSGGKAFPSWLVAPEAARLRAENQASLALLSPQGRHVIALQSRHFPQITEPALVVSSIEQVVSAATF
jgi:pimeloyl-ACP methyl ester carboxylesterase